MKEKEKIYSLFSDLEMLNELSYEFRSRNIEQKFLYLWNGAKKYYSVKQMIWTTSWWGFWNDVYNFWKKNCIINWKKHAFISLWCWNSWMEKFFFNKIINDYKNINISYFWVDSSREMLELSIENLLETKIDEKTFICADFSSREFWYEISKFTSLYDNNIYMFFWNTFWNINHTNIVDVLGNLLKKWEKIWLNVALRNWTTAKDDFELLESYKELLNDKNWLHNQFDILKDNWISFDYWNIWIVSTIEESINAQKFQFYFEFNEKVVRNIRNEKIIFLKWERIKLLQIYEYEPKSLINFFNEHNFKCVDEKYSKWEFSRLWQFLFEKM